MLFCFKLCDYLLAGVMLPVVLRLGHEQIWVCVCVCEGGSGLVSMTLLNIAA